MNTDLSNFAARLRDLISNRPSAIGHQQFNELAVELFSFQFKHNAAYRRICEARGLTPQTVKNWSDIPAVPTGLFKELELTSIPQADRIAVFHSSGTTEQTPSRHFHGAESLAVYEWSLVSWFFPSVLPDFEMTNDDLRTADKSAIGNRQSAIFLTPPPQAVPHSSLVHMFETVRQKFGETSVPAGHSEFFGQLASDGSWTLDFEAVVETLAEGTRTAGHRPLLLLGTAFSFVHLLDHLAERTLQFKLPAGSRVMETGGYKNRSRSMPKVELHALIRERLGVSPENIICEYGMSELSSQAYDSPCHPQSSIIHPRVFRFPPWARAQIISPETGQEVGEGETGLIRILDLANVYSVAAIQTEDLGIRRGDGFELIGRAQLAEPRGCSLMAS